jgi:hypothetical protein
MRVPVKPLLLLVLGFSWLAVDLNLIVGPTVLRETRLGFIARSLDKLPSAMANAIDAFLWICLLLGWMAPLTWGFVSLLRTRRKNA